MSQEENRWLSLNEISAYLGVSNDTVYKWLEKHKMPGHRLGRLWKFKRDEVDEWVHSGGTAHSSDKSPHAMVK